MRKLYLLVLFLLLSSCMIDKWIEIQFDRNVLYFGPEGGTETITATTMSGGRVIEWWDVSSLSVDSWVNQPDVTIDEILTARKTSPTTLEISVSPSAVPRTMAVYVSGGTYRATIRICQE